MAVKTLLLFTYDKPFWHCLEQEEPDPSHQKGVHLFSRPVGWVPAPFLPSARVLWLQRERKRELRACAGLIYIILKMRGKYYNGGKRILALGLC